MDLGRVSRISPEAPVPVVAVADHSFTLGGAGNVASNLRAIGAQRRVRGRGRRRARRAVRSLFERSTSTQRGIVRGRPADDAQDAHRRAQPTGRARRLGIDRSALATRPRADCAIVARLVAGRDAVILSDYAKGLICSARSSKRRAPRDRAADPKPKNVALSPASRASRPTPPRQRAYRDPIVDERASNAPACVARAARLPLRGHHARRTRHGALRTARRASAHPVGRADGVRRKRRRRYGHRGADAALAAGAPIESLAAGELRRRRGRRKVRHGDGLAGRDRRARGETRLRR